MTQEDYKAHPVTPPPELVEKWVAATQSNDCIGAYPANYEQLICIAAARWGADQELEACRSWLRHEDRGGCGLTADWLYEARRPKPLSHKELALIALTALEACASQSSDTTESVFYIRRALEQLDD